MKKQLSIGFMLFAMFFGAGNLIFPPKLGLESGHFFWPVMIGFVDRCGPPFNRCYRRCAR